MANQEHVDTFDNAELFGDSDEERLSCTSPEEFLAERIDAAYSPGDTVDSLLDALDEVEVVAYKHEELSSLWFDVTAQSVLETVFESFDEDYGDPDEYTEVSKEQKAQYLAKITEVLKFIVKDLHVWVCKEVGSQTYTREELRPLVEELINEA